MSKDTDIFKREKEEWYTFPLTFWDIVDKLNWKDNCNKHIEELQQKFYELCNGNIYVMEYFFKVFLSYKDAVGYAIDEYDLTENSLRCSGYFFKGGDDSFDDLCSHIVGMGKDVTLAVIAHPGKAAEYFDKYVESFAYCFHY